MTIHPIEDRVVLRPLTDEESGSATASGIIIPDTAAKEAPGQGIVVAVGPGKFEPTLARRIPIELKVGDRVFFSKYSYEEVKLEDKDYYIVAEPNLLAVVK